MTILVEKKLVEKKDTMNNLAEAVEAVESHLHPVPSWEVDAHPLPTGREEVWRFTPIRRLRPLFKPFEGELSHIDWDADQPDEVVVRTLTSEEARELAVEAPIDRVSALVGATGSWATLFEVPAEVECVQPLSITLHGEGRDSRDHFLFRVGNHAKVTIVVRHEGSATLASKMDVIVGDGAQVNFVTLQDWADDTIHAGQTSFLIGRDAQVRTVSVSLGGSVVRISETTRFAGPGGSIEQFGLYFVDAGQHIEHRLFVDHNAPHTRSNVDYRGALQGQGAHSVWVGDVLIRKIAEGIETYESNKNLVLTDGCQADSVPNLEIQTGEIAGAGHSSTTGRFDDEQLFYLQSRGIEESEAKRLVVHGFFNDIIRRIGVPELEAHLREVVETELASSLSEVSQ